MTKSRLPFCLPIIGLLCVSVGCGIANHSNSTALVGNKTSTKTVVTALKPVVEVEPIAPSTVAIESFSLLGEDAPSSFDPPNQLLNEPGDSLSFGPSSLVDPVLVNNQPTSLSPIDTQIANPGIYSESLFGN